MLTGGCFCGRVRYEADAQPFHQTVCHCSSCRRAVGAASVAWFSLPRQLLRWTALPPKRFVSTPGVTRTFCDTCGTSLTYEAEGHPSEIDITIASLDDPGAVPPRDHTQAASKVSWVALDDGLPVYPDGRPAG